MKKCIRPICELGYLVRNSNGFSLIATMMIMVILMAFSTAFVSFLLNENKATSEYQGYVTAQECARVGLERALGILSDYEDWRAVGPTPNLFTNEPFEKGSFTVTLTEIQQDHIRINSAGVVNKQVHTLSRVLDREMNYSQKLNVNTINSIILINNLQNVKLMNESQIEPVVITGMEILWDDSGSPKKITGISIDSSKVWSGVAGHGETIFFTEAVTVNIQDVADLGIEFEQSMQTESFSLYFRLSDGSVKQVYFTPDSGSNAYYLHVDTDSLSAAGNKYNILRPMHLSNLNPAVSIVLDKIQLSWIPDKSEVIKRIRIDLTPKFNQTAKSGDLINLTDTTLTHGFSYEMDIKFNNSDMRNKVFTFIFYMTDGSTKNVQVNLGIDQAEHLAVDTSQAKYNGNSILEQVYLQNLNEDVSIFMDEILISWQPNKGQNLTQIDLAGTPVKVGSFSSGTLIDLAEDELEAEQRVPLDLRFDAEITKATYNITFTMADGSQKIVPAFSPGSSQPFKDMITIATRDARIKKNETNIPLELTDISIVNTSIFNAVELKEIQVEWTPDKGEKIEAVIFEGIKTYTDSSGWSSGDLIDLAGASIEKNTTVKNTIRFDQAVTSKNIIVTLTFSDHSYLVYGFNEDPGQYIGGHTFNNGSYGGGYGWSGHSWERNQNQTYYKFVDDENSFSSQKSFAIFGNNTKKPKSWFRRRINLFGNKGIYLRMHIRAALKNNEDIYLYATDNYNPSEDDMNTTGWKLLRSWSDDDNAAGYVYEEWKLSDFGLFETEDFCIKFISEMVKKKSHLYFDNVYFFKKD